MFVSIIETEEAMFKLILGALFLLFYLSGQAIPVEPNNFTQKDRELLIELHTTLKVYMDQVEKRFAQIDKRFEQIDKRFEQIDKRFEDVDKRMEELSKGIDQLQVFLWILSGIFTSLVIFVIGFAYWDRRTIIKKAKDETLRELNLRYEMEDINVISRLIRALREYAKSDQRMEKALAQFNLL